jgi:hypothetical protein
MALMRVAPEARHQGTGHSATPINRTRPDGARADPRRDLRRLIDRHEGVHVTRQQKNTPSRICAIHSQVLSALLRR